MCVWGGPIKRSGGSEPTSNKKRGWRQCGVCMAGCCFLAASMSPLAPALPSTASHALSRTPGSTSRVGGAMSRTRLSPWADPSSTLRIVDTVGQRRAGRGHSFSVCLLLAGWIKLKPNRRKSRSSNRQAGILSPPKGLRAWLRLEVSLSHMWHLGPIHL